MKYAVTGHTYGIGQALFKKLQPNVIGFSKSTGYDITKREIRNRIIQDVYDCDVFINNAPAGFGQSEMCLELWHVWKDTNKTIINIGSRIAEDCITLDLNYTHLLEYSMHKKTLKALTHDLSMMDVNVTVKYKWFGYVGTPRILEKYPHFKSGDYISIDDAVRIILDE